MGKLIAACGLDCGKCEARKATLVNDDSLKEKIAKEWTELNNVLITKEMINCLGCLEEGVKTPFCESLCPIRKCVISKKIMNCGKCDDLNRCEKIKMIIDSNCDALKNLKED